MSHVFIYFFEKKKMNNGFAACLCPEFEAELEVPGKKNLKEEN